jgi:hypothetical protein
MALPECPAMGPSKLVGILLIALGALLLLGWLHVPYLTTLLGIVLIVVGVMVLAGSLHGARWLGIVALVLGILLLFPGVPAFSRALGFIGDLLTTVIAVVLIVMGVLKLVGRA